MFWYNKVTFIKLILLYEVIIFYTEASKQIQTLYNYYSLQRYQLQTNIANLAYSPDQRLMIVFRQNDHHIYVYNGVTYKQINIIQTQPSEYPFSFAFFPNTTSLIVGSKIGTLYSYKINNNQIESNFQKIRQNNEKLSINSISINLDGLIAVGGQNKEISFYKLDQEGKFTKIYVIQLQMIVTCMKFVEKGSKLLVGGTLKFLYKVIIQNYNISLVQQFEVNEIDAAQSSYYAAISEQKIHFYDQSTDSLFFNYSLVNQNLSHIKVSQDGLYIIFSFENKLIALGLENTQKQAFESAYQFFQTDGQYFIISNSGSNLLIIQEKQRGLVHQYSLCQINYYYSVHDRNCVPCISGCSKCLQSSRNCFQCQFGFYLLNQTCQLCSNSMKGCISCRQKNICDLCNDNKHFIIDPKTNFCICKIGYFQKYQEVCVSCNITGCSTCLQQNTCQTCDTSSGFIYLPLTLPVRCICQQDRYFNPINMKCQICSKFVTGCLKCLDSRTCTICNQLQHYKKQAASGLCQCKQTYLLTENSCQSCSKFIVGCQKCKNKIQCLTCKKSENFIIDESTKLCKCEQGYFFDKIQSNCAQCCFLCQTCQNGKFSCKDYNFIAVFVCLFVITVAFVGIILACYLIKKKKWIRRKQKWLRQQEQYQKQENKAQNFKKSLLDSIESLQQNQLQKNIK